MLNILQRTLFIYNFILMYTISANNFIALIYFKNIYYFQIISKNK